MEPLKLTHSERITLSEKLRTELATEESSGVQLEFEKFSDISVIIEYDSLEDSIILSFKVQSVSDKLPYEYIGCPDTIGELETVGVRNICTEIDTVLENEFGWQVDVSASSFTLYDWKTDTAWYLYETTVGEPS